MKKLTCGTVLSFLGATSDVSPHLTARLDGNVVLLSPLPPSSTLAVWLRTLENHGLTVVVSEGVVRVARPEPLWITNPWGSA